MLNVTMRGWFQQRASCTEHVVILKFIICFAVVYRFISGIKIDIFTITNSKNNILIFFTVPFFGNTFYSTLLNV